MSKTIRIDDDAYNRLIRTKAEMKKDGIEKPSLADAIRYMDVKI